MCRIQAITPYRLIEKNNMNVPAFGKTTYRLPNNPICSFFKVDSNSAIIFPFFKESTIPIVQQQVDNILRTRVGSNNIPQECNMSGSREASDFFEAFVDMV